MIPFGEYSKYYDLLYRDKPYQEEANFVDSLLTRFASKPAKSLLELGSGTGKHALHLAQMGYAVHGVDQSQTMLEMAGNLLINAPDVATKLSFQQGDIRTISINLPFDAAISLFHVMSYQTTNSDLCAVFQNVKNHVKRGGIFIFDCWYGPAVLRQLPEVRFKQLENDTSKIERIAVPTLHENEDLIDVQYHLFFKEKSEKSYHKIEETHRMRYLFLPELVHLFNQFEMKLLYSCEWLTEKTLSQHTWGACFVVGL